MKDLVISGKRVKTELIVLLGCFIASFCTNIGAIIAYHKSWTEMFSQIGFVVVIAVAFYAILLIIRLIILLFKKLLKR